jgi:hypothetical protein
MIQALLLLYLMATKPLAGDCYVTGSDKHLVHPFALFRAIKPEKPRTSSE